MGDVARGTNVPLHTGGSVRFCDIWLIRFQVSLTILLALLGIRRLHLSGARVGCWGAAGLVRSSFCLESTRVRFDRYSLSRLPLAVLLLASVTLVAACNKSSVKLFPVKGKVLFKDQPAEGAQVVFLPAGEENSQF